MVNNILVIISGPSGVGKSEIVKRLLTYQELNGKQLINATTRPPRFGEVDGQDFYFVNKEEFLKNAANNQFLNYIEYNNNYYGIPLNGLKEGLSSKNMLQIATVETYQKLKVTWTESKMVSFWLQPPYSDKLLSNLRKRGDKEEDIAKRLAIAETEMPFAREYDYIYVVNDNLDQVAWEIKTKILSSIEQQQQNFQTRIEVLPKK